MKAALTVSVAGAPTGTVFNGNAADFAVSQNGKSGAARFLFATEGGTILGWTPTVNANTAVVGADRSSVGAVYKGLAVASDRLYASDFHNGRVDVFDASFKLITTSGGFKDAKVAKGFAPFGIQALGGNIFVTYAKQDSAKKDDVPVPGQAYVDEFTPDGQLVARVVNSGKKNAPLNAPWGLAMAPADFSVFGGDLLVGQLRQRTHQRLHAAGQQVGLQGPAARRHGRTDRDRRSLGDRLRQRRRGRTDEHAVLPVRPGRREARALRIDHRGLSHTEVRGGEVRRRDLQARRGALRSPCGLGS